MRDLLRPSVAQQFFQHLCYNLVMLELQSIVMEKGGGIAKIILNRPEAMNALDDKVINELWAATEDVRVDKAIRVAIIGGKGRAFCAGIDLKHAVKLTTASTLDTGAFLRRMQETFRLERLEIPVIASVNGYALGEGCDLALACDFRIASEDARFGMTYTQLGLAPAVGGASRLIQLVGASKAKELIFFGDMVDAAEALRIGMVDRVVPPGELDATVLVLAERLARRAPLAMALAKRSMNVALEESLKKTMDFDMRAQSTCFQSQDALEGITARTQRREPRFQGK